MTENVSAQASWCCPHPGCGRAYPELWRLRSHYRQPTKGTSPNRGHGEELLECPRCTEPLSLLKNARHRCKMAPARLAAAAAATAVDGAEGSGADSGALRARKRRRVRWQDVHGSGSSSDEEDGTMVLDDSEEDEEVVSTACLMGADLLAAVATAATAASGAAAEETEEEEEGEEPPLLAAPLLCPHATPRGAAAAELLVRIRSGGLAPLTSMASPAVQPVAHGSASGAAGPLAEEAAMLASAADHSLAAGPRWWQVAVQPALADGGVGEGSLQGPLPVQALQPFRPVQPTVQVPMLVKPPAAAPRPLPHRLVPREAALLPAQQQQIQAPLPLAVTAAQLLGQLLELLKNAVSKQDAEEFISLVVRHTAERQSAATATAAAAATSSAAPPPAARATCPGAAPDAASPAGNVCPEHALLSGLVAELQVRCGAISALLTQQRHRELREAVHKALSASRLAAAVSQLSALLARSQQPVAGMAPSVVG